MRRHAAVAAATAVVAVLGACTQDTTSTGASPPRPPAASGARSPAATATDPPSPSPSPEPSLSPTPTETTVTGCSAAGLPPWESQGLPAPVEEMRREIIDAAIACDLQRLEDLALAGSQGFTFSYGADPSPARHWRRAERHEDVLATLVNILRLEPVEDQFGTSEGDDEPGYSWPAAYQDSPSAADWRELIEAGIYTRSEVRRMKQFGSYIGYRAGITRSGDWIFFVAGD